MQREIKFRAWLEPQNKMETGLFGLRSDGVPSFQSNISGFKVTLMQSPASTTVTGKKCGKGIG